MGFRTGAYAKCWSVEPKTDSITRLRISVSKKNKSTGEYEQDFSGFATVFGSAAAKKAAGLKEGDRIKLGDVDVSTTYDKERNKEYINYKIFSFELSDEGQSSQGTRAGARDEVQGDEFSEDMLPF